MKPLLNVAIATKNAERVTKPWLYMKFFHMDRLLMKTPDHYKHFYWMWKFAPRTPVNYIPNPNKFEKLENEEVVPTADESIPSLFPIEFDQMLTGGEGVVKGFSKKDKRWSKQHPRYWFPRFYSSIIYSEILNERMEVKCTSRVLNLIDEYYGLDNYILKSSIPDLHTELAVKLRRKMLFALTDQTLYPEDNVKKDELLNQYADCLIPRDELEWFGLNIHEARLKQTLINEAEEDARKKPLKHAFREQLIEYLKSDEYKKIREEAKSDEAKERNQAETFSRFVGGLTSYVKKKF